MAIQGITTTRRILMRALPFFPFVPATALAAATEHDPVLAALEIYAQARADFMIELDRFTAFEAIAIGRPELQDQLEVVELASNLASDREDEAAETVLLAKPTTEEGALQLAHFAANQIDRDLYAHVGAACRTLGDWLVARRRARVGA